MHALWRYQNGCNESYLPCSWLKKREKAIHSSILFFMARSMCNDISVLLPEKNGISNFSLNVVPCIVFVSTHTWQKPTGRKITTACNICLSVYWGLIVLNLDLNWKRWHHMGTHTHTVRSPLVDICTLTSLANKRDCKGHLVCCWGSSLLKVACPILLS